MTKCWLGDITQPLLLGGFFVAVFFFFFSSVSTHAHGGGHLFSHSAVFHFGFFLLFWKELLLLLEERKLIIHRHTMHLIYETTIYKKSCSTIYSAVQSLWQTHPMSEWFVKKVISFDGVKGRTNHVFDP